MTPDKITEAVEWLREEIQPGRTPHRTIEAVRTLLASRAALAAEVERLTATMHPEPERTTEVVAEAYAYMKGVGQIPEPALLIQRLTSRLERIRKSQERSARQALKDQAR